MKHFNIEDLVVTSTRWHLEHPYIDAWRFSESLAKEWHGLSAPTREKISECVDLAIKNKTCGDITDLRHWMTLQKLWKD